MRAKVLTLVTAQTFLMLSAQGILAGARAEIDIRKRFGPAKVHLYAYLEIGGHISFERPHMGGDIGAGGKIEGDIWIVGLSLGSDALFAVEAAQPFLIYAELRIRPCVKIVFVRICKSFTIKLKWEKDATVNRTPISPMPHAKQTELAKGIHMLTHQSFDLNSFTTPPTVSQIDKVIPLDTYIEFKTEKGLLPGAITNTIGGYTFAPENVVDLVPPQKTVRGGKQIRQVKHRYSIEDIEVKAWNGTTWMDYHPFEAIVAPDNRPEVANLKIGYWQIKEKQYDTIRLLATTPFTYLEAGEPGWYTPEVYGMTASTLYCEETTKKEDCSNMLLQDLGQKMRMPDGYLGHYIQRAYYSIGQNSGYEMINGQALAIEEDYMEITNAINPHEFAQSLTFRNGNSLIIYLPEDAVQVKLWLTTYAQGVTIKYYATGINDQRSQVAHYLVQEEYKTAGQLQSAVEYENLSQAIIKIIIDPDQPDIERIQNIEEQIAQLFQDTYEGLSGIVKISEPKDRDQYEKLIGELDKLKNIGCTAVDSDCKKDEMLCALYDKLLDLFESCFIYPVSEGSIWELLDQVDCFNLFYNLIFNFNTDHPEYHLLESMGELYTYFDDTWRQLEEMMGHYPEIPAGEIIAQYYYFRELSIEVMDFILKLGECDCDDKPKQVCTTSLQQVCWLSMEKHQWNETLPGAAAIEADFEAMTDAVEKEAQPIWRPNTPYYIKCLLKDEVDNGESTPGQFSLYYGFKTVGPLGHYHKNPASNYVPSGASPDAYPLSSLRAYVDEKRSFPNINGNLLKAKPLFYGNEQCKISVFFNTPLAEHMFQKWHSYQNMTEWEGQLHIAIKDPITNVIIPYPLPANYFERSVPVADADGYQWVVDQHPQLPPHIQLINNLIENGDLPCRIDLGQAIKPRSRSFQVTLTNLMPQKLYTALLYNAFGTTEDLVSELVHDFVFQTSRYKNFSEQINSYIIEDEETTIQKQAVYSLSIALTTAQITKVFAIIANPNNQTNDYPLANIYQDLFYRIWEVVLQIPPQDAAERTEFVRIKNTHTQEVIAIWIRNPEPFNNPKIPLDQIADMIQIVTVIGNPENEYKIIYSKDYSQALVMHSSLSIQASSLGFKFNYYNWNGNAYEIEDTVQVSDISIS